MPKTISEYLSDLTPYTITDGAIENILLKVDVEGGAYVSDLTPRQLNLCTAYTYLWLSQQPTTSARVKDADGSWSHEEGSMSISAADKYRLYLMAKGILDQYGISAGPSSIKMAPRGMRVFPRHK